MQQPARYTPPTTATAWPIGEPTVNVLSSEVEALASRAKEIAERTGCPPGAALLALAIGYYLGE